MSARTFICIAIAMVANRVIMNRVSHEAKVLVPVALSCIALLLVGISLGIIAA